MGDADPGDTASTPGLEAPADVILDAYSKPASNTQHGLSSQLLLHTSEAHAKLDYTAREEKSGITDDLLKHYVGVFDPASGELQLVPARKMVVRGTLRTARTVEEDGDEGMPYQVRICGRE
jgi:DNA-directed RNA polymerase I subunit RPA49